jgi:hypothetical protein
MSNQNKNFIHDQEKLYRSIEADKRLYKNIDGKLYLSSQAFCDRQEQPSVDRAELCNHDPKHTKKSKKAGVVYLLTHEVRNSKIFSQHPDGDVNYQLDAKAAPSPKNQAHALIIGKPKYKSDRAFKKVQERLAILAAKNGWCLMPDEE